MKLPRAFGALLLVLTAGFMNAPAFAGDLKVEEPWIRGTVPVQKATGAFMRLSSTTRVRLTGARTPVAEVVEIHEMRMEGDTMHMRRMSALDVGAGQAVELKPGGYHIMLMGLKQTLQAGQKVPLTLEFETGGKPQTMTVDAEVRSLTGQPAGH